MTITELVEGIAKVRNSHACGLMADCLRRKIGDRRRAFLLLNERKDVSWDLSTDLWIEIDRLENLLDKAENKTRKLSSEGF